MSRGFVTAILLSCAAGAGCAQRFDLLGVGGPGAPLEVRLMPGEEVLLDGAGSFDPEGEELSFRWRQVSGPQVDLAGADTPWPRFVPPAPGRYEFELVVSAPPVGAPSEAAALPLEGGPARLIVDILPPNRPPVIAIDEELRAEPGQWAALDGGRVTDPDGDHLTFEWRLRRGNAVEMKPADGRARYVMVRTWRAGEYVFELVVRDSWGAESRAELRLRVAPNDRPPVAIVRLAEREDAPGRHYPVRLAAWPHRSGGVDSRPLAEVRASTREVDGYTEVTLDGSASRDPDGDDLEFRWEQTGGPHVRTLYPDAQRGMALVSFDAPAEGQYRFRLVVSDGVLDSDPVELKVAVGETRGGPAASGPLRDRGRPDMPGALRDLTPAGLPSPGFASPGFASFGLSFPGPAVDAGKDVFGEVGTEIALSGSTVVRNDRGGTRFLYDWRQMAGPRVRSFRIPSLQDFARPRFTPEEPGRYVFSLRASEDGIKWGAPDLVTVSVLAADLPPRVVLPPRVIARAGRPVRIVARCGDPDGDRVRVGWRVVSGTKSERKSLQLEFDGPVATLLAPRRGEVMIECIARDSRGGEAAAVTVIESRAAGRAPVASVSAPRLARPGGRVVLDGSESFDPEGEELAFRWEVSGDLILKLKGSDRPRAVFRPAAPGRYEFRLVVTAGGRASSPARAAVLVKEAEDTDPGLLEVAPLRTRVGAGRPVVLYAPGAEGLDCSWRQIGGPVLDMPPTRRGRVVLHPAKTGRYAFRLVAPDNRTPGGVPRSRVVGFDVSESNARPVVSARAEVRAGGVVLDGTGSADPDGDPLRLRWFQLEGPPLDLAGPSASAPRLRLVNAPPGRYAVRLVATDGERVARSAVVRFVVPEDGNHR